MTDSVNAERVIRLLHLVNDQPTPFDGQYVVEYDPSRDGVRIGWMNFHLVTTPHLAEATRYTIEQAADTYLAVDARQPIRPDGKPNRPLTAFHVMSGPPEQIEGLSL